jgi:lysozyme family protein
MLNFEFAILKIFEKEGFDQVTNDPVDSGGLTKWGISQKAFPGYDIESLTYQEAKDIYKKYYWSPLGCEYIHSDKIAMELFDFGVNARPVTAIRCIQKALNLIQFPVQVDGRMGPYTVQRINEAILNYDQALLNGLVGFEFMHYYALVQRDPKQLKFIRGWLARLI